MNQQMDVYKYVQSHIVHIKKKLLEIMYNFPYLTGCEPPMHIH